MKYLKNTLIVIFWLFVWHVAASLVDNNILAVTPLDTLKTVGRIINSGELLSVLTGSMGRIMLGLLCAVLTGVILSIFSYRISFFESLFKPLVLAMKSIPVVSIVVLLLIWQGSEKLSVWISFLISFPIIYTNILEGMKGTDKKILEMADIFEVSLWNRICYIYRPSVRGFLTGGMKLAAGMSIKAGVAAEIIGLPNNSFGERLYEAKIYLATDELFAWTVLIVATAFITEKILVYFTNFLIKAPIPYIDFGHRKREGGKPQPEERKEDGFVVRLRNISKTYGGKVVLSDVSMELKKGEKVGIMAPSGAGKTTLFRIILGLEKPEKGSVCVNGRIGAVFQEPLLCEESDMAINMRITGAKTEDITYLQSKLFKEEIAKKPVAEFSLGMKRRCSIIRSLARDFDVLILDEPFASLDDENRSRAAEAIKEKTKDKAIIIFTHNEEDIRLIGGEKINIINCQ